MKYIKGRPVHRVVIDGHLVDKITPQEAKRIAQRAGISFSWDFHAKVSLWQAGELQDLAKRVGYRKPKYAKGSTARYFFAYLQRLK